MVWPKKIKFTKGHTASQHLVSTGRTPPRNQPNESRVLGCGADWWEVAGEDSSPPSLVILV